MDNSAFLQFIWKTDVVESWIGRCHTIDFSFITWYFYIFEMASVVDFEAFHDVLYEICMYVVLIFFIAFC